MITSIRPISQVVAAGTGTVTPDFDPTANFIYLSTAAPITLTASFSLNLVNFQLGTDLYIPVYYDGDVTLDTFDFNVAGISIKQSKLKGKAMFMLFYSAATTSWSIIVESDDNQLPDVIAGEKVITAPTSGTVTLVPGIDENYVRVTGTQTLSGNYTIAFANGVANDWFYIDVRALITTGANVLNIGTIVIDAATALAGNYTIIAYCAGGADWRAQIVNGNIDTTKLAAGSVALSKLAQVSAFTVLANATNATAGATAVALTSQYHILSRGASTLESTLITPAMLRAGGIAAFAPKSFNVGNAQLLDIFSTPVQIEAAPGAAFRLDIASIKGRVNYATAAFATSTDLFIRYVGATNPIAGSGGILAATGTQTVTFAPLEGDVIENAGLEIYAVTNNPTAGGGTLTLFYDLDVKFEPLQ
jgi:hypothetical protein